MTVLLDHFSDLQDPRWDRYKLHNFNDILFITICATICGADGWTDIEHFAQAKEDWLRQHLELPNGIPSDDTFCRVISQIKPEAFEACFRRWTTALFEQTAGELIALDGKTLRGSYDRDDDKAALCMVSAWASANNLPRRRSLTNPMRSQPSRRYWPPWNSVAVWSRLMRWVPSDRSPSRSATRTMCWRPGSNHPTLYADVRTFFDEGQAKQFQGIAHDYYQHTDGGHARIEVRRCWCVEDVDWLRHQDRWAGLKSLVKIEARRIVGNRESVEQRYYISSLPAQAERLLAAVRGHWGIENTAACRRRSALGVGYEFQ